jgi:hypothetical protein
VSYTVGQVLYVVLRKEASVYPMQVVEEITKKTLEGEVTTYMVRAGAGADKVLAVSDIDGEVFDSAEKAKKVLIERVSASIAQRVDQAVQKAKEWYPSGREIVSDDPMSLIKKVTTIGEQPAKPNKKPPQPSMKAETAQLAAELAAEAENGLMMEVPDGKGGVTMAKVKGVKLPPQLQG